MSSFVMPNSCAVTGEELTELMMSMSYGQQASYSGNLQTLAEQLSTFATEHSVSMAMISNFTAEPTNAKIVDKLYKLNPAQWELLQDQYHLIDTSSIELIERMNSFL